MTRLTIRSLVTESALDQLIDCLCPLCEQRSQGSQLCEVCVTWLQPLPAPCPVCAAPNTGNMACGRCQQHPPPWQRASISWVLDGATRFLIHRMKYHQDYACARALARQWWLLNGTHLTCPDALVPVPLHRKKARERGFNQSHWLAEYWGKQANTPVWTGLIKEQSTVPLEGLNRAQRRQTLKGAFSILEKPPKRVAIVDDVLTTGATASELARVLKRAGTLHVELWALARTPLGEH